MDESAAMNALTRAWQMAQDSHAEAERTVLAAALRLVEARVLSTEQVTASLGFSRATWYRRRAAEPRLDPDPRLCAVCQAPHQPDHPDPLHDVMYHAQCRAILANLERELTS